jgi:hypothetical protein
MLVLVVLWMFAWLACEVTFVSAGIHVGLLDAWVWLCNLASLALTVAWVRMVSVSPRSRR